LESNLHKQAANRAPEDISNSLATSQTGHRDWVAEGRARLRNPAIVVFTYNRPHYLRQTLQSLSHVPGLSRFSVYVSQDGDMREVAAVANTFGGLEGDASAPSKGELAPPHVRAFELWQHPRVPLIGPSQHGHAWVAQHYKWALDRAFNDKSHSHVILVEDDMLFAIDFVRYFEATAPLLDLDPTIWCVSSWNDNGLKKYTWDSHRMFRTTYFPGLGWMLRKELWDEIGPKFPKEHWDHWMRLDTTAQGRECVVPEVNRNFNIGEKGANMESRTYEKYLSKMMISNDLPDSYGDLDYLTKSNYEQWMAGVFAGARHWPTSPDSPESIVAAMGEHHEGQTIVLTYRSETYTRLADRFEIWPFPRAHHLHASYLRYKGVLFILADARFCPYLPENLKVLPSPGLRPIPAQRGADCVSTCKDKGLQCMEHEFWFINTCKILEEHFSCARGCALVLGPDIPNFVEDPSLSTYHQCLVNQEEPKCSARHPGTSRLCACS